MEPWRKPTTAWYSSESYQARASSLLALAFALRAALDTVSFMPLTQTDSNGGVIVTAPGAAIVALTIR